MYMIFYVFSGCNYLLTAALCRWFEVDAFEGVVGDHARPPGVTAHLAPEHVAQQVIGFRCFFVLTKQSNTHVMDRWLAMWLRSHHPATDVFMCKSQISNHICS